MSWKHQLKSAPLPSCDSFAVPGASLATSLFSSSPNYHSRPYCDAYVLSKACQQNPNGKIVSLNGKIIPVKCCYGQPMRYCGETSTIKGKKTPAAVRASSRCLYASSLQLVLTASSIEHAHNITITYIIGLYIFYLFISAI